MWWIEIQWKDVFIAQTVFRLCFSSGDFQSEMQRLVSLNYTVNMEYTSPSNHVFTSYSQPQLTVLSIRSHADGQTLFGTRLKAFLFENHFLTIFEHLVPFELVPSNVTHQQLLQEIYQQHHGEGYVVEIIHPDRPSYLVKIRTQKYLTTNADGGTADSARALFEAIINGNPDDLVDLFRDDAEILKRIEEMEQKIRPKYNRMLQSVEQFYQANKHLSKKDYVREFTTNEEMKIYSPLLMRLYAGEENDYKGFATKHTKELFAFGGNGNQSVAATESFTFA